MLTFGDFWKIVLAIYVADKCDVAIDAIIRSIKDGRYKRRTSEITTDNADAIDDTNNHETIGFKYKGEKTK